MENNNNNNQMTKIIDNLYKIEGNGICSICYVLYDNNKTLLIDSGNGTLKFLFTPDLSILTHNHTDHTKGVRKEWNKVLMHKNDINKNNEYSHVPNQTKKIDFNELKWGNFNLKLIETPGHTAGSICLYETNNKILFSGDTIFHNGYVGRTDLGGNERELAHSLNKLKKIDYKLLCPGH